MLPSQARFELVAQAVKEMGIRACLVDLMKNYHISGHADGI